MAIKINTKKIKALNRAVKKHKVDFVVLFGSQKNGKTHKNSDLDIAVMSGEKETYRKFGMLFNELSKIFKGYNVDLRFIKGSEPVFLYSALVEGKFLAGDIMEFYHQRAFAYKNFIDSKSLFELKEKLLSKRQKQLNKNINGCKKRVCKK